MGSSTADFAKSCMAWVGSEFSLHVLSSLWFILIPAYPLCADPIQPGKGYWVQEDRSFGHGLNVPRTRHASEIIKTAVS